VINSGVANACNGARGERDALTAAETAAKALGVKCEDVYVCSTGSIGQPLPMNIIQRGINTLVHKCSVDGGEAATAAIMTTDTHPKRWTVKLKLAGHPVTITGVAKGAGMIEPNMATMLSFILTDAAVEPAALQTCLSGVVNCTFNRITVDGDMSTNDTVLMMANGASGGESLSANHADWKKFCGAVEEIASRLAWMIVADAEGATKVVTVNVVGAVDAACAEKAARAVGNSFLIKTGWAGENPAVGRVMDALGYSGAQVDAEKIEIIYKGVPAVSAGVCDSSKAGELCEVVSGAEFTLDINLNQGDGTATVYTCNITEKYVRINM
jgi:glutamate N-acetyltransferase/amino-acid N-acetyltransferase